MFAAVIELCVIGDKNMAALRGKRAAGILIPYINSTFNKTRRDNLVTLTD